MAADLNVSELLEKYQILIAENKALKEENKLLKERLGITDQPRPAPPQVPEKHLSLGLAAQEPPGENRS